MAKLILNDVGNILTAGTTINTNNQRIEDAMENTLSRDGTTPNEMNAPIDMNNNRITNLPVPIGSTEPVRKFELDNFVGSPGPGVPSGGTVGQILSKIDSTDYNTQWITFTKSSIGLGNVDNTSDVSKPISADTQTALNGKQNLDATLTALAGVTVSADQTLYATGADAFATTPLTAFARTLLDDPDSATARATLGVGTGTGDVVGPLSATDNAIVRFDTGTGKLVQNSPLVLADTTGDLSRSGGGGVDIQGTNTNDDAPIGYIGEVISSTIPNGSAVTLTTSTVANITSISLTAGDWDVSGQVAFANTATGVTSFGGAIHTVSATLPTPDLITASRSLIDCAAVSLSSANVIPITTCRISVNTTTTVYLMGRLVFSGGTGSAFGRIIARRAR